MPKISVNNEGGEDESPKPSVKKVKKVLTSASSARGKKKPVKTVKPAKVAKKEASIKAAAPVKATKKVAPPVKTKKNKKGSLLFTLIVVAVTATIVGAGMHAWQKKNVTSSVEKIQKSARTTRIDFENRISNLKNKITGFETEKEELLTENEELKKKAELVEKAKVNFENEMLGLSLDYPARFGKINVNITDKGEGKVIRGEFADNEKLSFGCVSKNLPKNENASMLSFLDAQGFLEDDDEYYFLPQGEESKDYKLNPAKVINFSGGKALLVDKKSFVEGENEDILNVDIGENVGVIVNLNSETCTGLTFMNSDFGMLPLDQFIKIIESIKLK